MDSRTASTGSTRSTFWDVYNVYDVSTRMIFVIHKKLEAFFTVRSRFATWVCLKIRLIRYNGIYLKIQWFVIIFPCKTAILSGISHFQTHPHKDESPNAFPTVEIHGFFGAMTQGALLFHLLCLPKFQMTFQAGSCLGRLSDRSSLLGSSPHNCAFNIYI